MDTAELNNALKQRMGELVSMLYPNAKVKGNIAHLGSITGEAGDSFHIHVGGAKIGCFIDHANPTDKGGTPLYLWSKAKGISFAEAVREAKDFLGIRSDMGVKKHMPKQYAAPQIKGLGIKRMEPNMPSMDYLVGARKIDPMVIAANKIGDCNGGDTIVFPYFDDGNDKAVHIKFLNVERDADGKKKMWSSEGTKRCLFGKPAVTDNDREIVITEGEIDALSYQSVGIAAVSVPNGVSDTEWIELDWFWLERFEKIYISTDMDGPGREAAQKIAQRLGLHRTFIVGLPFKDANECLTNGMGREKFLECLNTSKQIDLEEIKSAGTYIEQVWELFDNRKGPVGYPTPWEDLPLRIRPGELTVFSGYSGHGKTQAINHLLIHLVSLGAKIFDASLEIKPSKTLQMMSRSALGKREPSDKGELVDCLEWLNQSMWFYDYVGVVNRKRLLEAMIYARKRFGIEIFVIDSLFKCGISGDDLDGQRVFMDELTSFCNDTNAHVILVAHSRKTENEDRVPTKTDIAGSQDINNAAFNVIIMWRNKLKQRKFDECVQKGESVKAVEVEQWFDGRMRLDKQRFGEGEDKDVPLYFDRISWQFWPKQHQRHSYFAHAKSSSAGPR